MTTAAILLVLASAVLHAVWNLFAKRASGGMVFLWLFSALSMVIYLPLVIYLLVVDQPPLGWAALAAIGVSSMLQLIYFRLLDQSYKIGDLSLVYPLARGSGPLLSALLAIILLGERPSAVAMIGALLITLGILFFAGNPLTIRSAGSGKAIAFALLTGVSIASYTLWDKQIVSVLLVPPLILDWSSGLVRTLVLLPHVLRRRAQLREEWRLHKREAFGIAVFSPLSYILLLTALIASPVSYVAPFRQISILIGALLGWRFLSEGDMRRRASAAVIMMFGVIALAFG